MSSTQTSMSSGKDTPSSPVAIEMQIRATLGWHAESNQVKPSQHMCMEKGLLVDAFFTLSRAWLAVSPLLFNLYVKLG